MPPNYSVSDIDSPAFGTLRTNELGFRMLDLERKTDMQERRANGPLTQRDMRTSMCLLRTRASMSHSERSHKTDSTQQSGIQTMLFLPQRYLDPLDREILERALEGAVVILSDGKPYEFGGDDELEAELRRELIEIAHSSGITDSEILRDRLLQAWAER